MNPTDIPIKDLDHIIFHPKRLLVLSFLLALGQLIKKCDLTWGELTAHLKQLEKAKYINQYHVPTLKGPRAVVKITQEGIQNYNITLEKLKAFLNM